jgi:hypothetical protein
LAYSVAHIKPVRKVQFEHSVIDLRYMCIALLIVGKALKKRLKIALSNPKAFP